MRRTLVARGFALALMLGVALAWAPQQPDPVPAVQRRSYAQAFRVGLPGDSKRWCVTLSSLYEGFWVGMDGKRADNPFAWSASPYPSPRLGAVRIALSIDGPAGWYVWTLHEADASGAPLDVPNLGGAVAHEIGYLYHDPTGRLGTDGKPVEGDSGRRWPSGGPLGPGTFQPIGP